MRMSVIISALVAVLVGFGRSVAIILSAADTLGATDGQKATWITVVCLSMTGMTAFLTMHLAWGTRNGSTPRDARVGGLMRWQRSPRSHTRM